MMTFPVEPPPGRLVLMAPGFKPVSNRWIDAFSDYMELRGVRLRRAASRAETLAWVERSEVDLTILSHDMPDVDGLSTLRAIRTISPDLPCLLVADEVPQRVLSRALELRAYSVVKQPVELNVLTGLSARILGTRQDGLGDQRR